MLESFRSAGFREMCNKDIETFSIILTNYPRMRKNKRGAYSGEKIYRHSSIFEPICPRLSTLVQLAGNGKKTGRIPAGWMENIREGADG